MQGTGMGGAHMCGTQGTAVGDAQGMGSVQGMSGMHTGSVQGTGKGSMQGMDMGGAVIR